MIKPTSIIITILLFLFQIYIDAQVETNLLTDTIKKNNSEIGRIDINKSDSTLNFIPVDSIENYAQEFEIRTKKSPGRAAFYSFLLPGLGQAYNGKYWKIPIIYGLFTGMYYLYDNNNFRYNLFKTAYKNYSVEAGVTTPGINPNISEDQLKSYKDYYRRNRDLNVIVAAVIYLFNILDANVDAHLMDFDVSDDLSLSIMPEINNYSILQYNPKSKLDYGNSFGVKFVLSMHKN